MYQNTSKASPSFISHGHNHVNMSLPQGRLIVPSTWPQPCDVNLHQRELIPFLPHGHNHVISVLHLLVSTSRCLVATPISHN